MKITASTLEGLFREAALAMMSYIKTSDGVQEPKTEREFEISAPYRTNLLIDFLNEILFLSRINKEIYNDIKFLDFSEVHLKAVLGGVFVDSFDKDIKAVAYHGEDILEVPHKDFEVEVVFDI